MTIRRRCTMSAVSFVLSLGTVAAAHAGEAPLVKVSAGDAARGVAQIAIGSFNVGFIFQSVDKTKAVGGFMGLVEGTTRAESKLVGITPEVMQAITDAAYADFTTKLAASGYSVQAPTALFAAPIMAKARAQTAPTDINIALEKKSTGKATYFKPGALPAQYIMAGDFVGSGMSSMGLAMAGGQTTYAFSQYARESGVSVVDVVYLIDFSQQKRPGAFAMGGLKINSGIAVVSEYSRASLVTPGGKITVLKLGQPVAVEGDFATMRDTVSGMGKATRTAGHVIGGLGRMFGGAGGGLASALGSGGNTAKLEFDAKPENYKAGATQAAILTNDRVIAQLKALR